MPTEEDNVIEMGPRREGSNKAAQIKGFVLEALAAYHESYRIVIDDASRLSCAKVVSPGVLKPIEDEVIMNCMATDFLGRAGAPLIKHEVFPVWRVRAAGLNGVQTRSIVPLVFLSDTRAQWSWQRLPFDPTESRDCPPELQSMLARTSPEEGRSLVLWLGSLLDYNFPRSQYLYLHGEGNDGKSTLIKMLEVLLGKQGVTYMNSDNFADSHSTTALEGARLLVFSDENSASFMSRGRFKAISGDDTLTINPKGLPRRNIALNCKILVASNYPPYVQGGRADLRRIVPVCLTAIPADESSHARGLAFIEARNTIMQHCYSEFKRWQTECPDRMLPASEMALQDAVADSMQTETDMVLDTLLEFNPDYSVTASKLYATLCPIGGRAHSKAGIQAMYAAIKRRGARRTNSREGSQRVWMWSGVRARRPE